MTRGFLVAALVTSALACSDDAKDAEIAAMKAEMAQLRTEMTKSHAATDTPPTPTQVVEAQPPPGSAAPAPRAVGKKSAIGQPIAAASAVVVEPAATPIAPRRDERADDQALFDQLSGNSAAARELLRQIEASQPVVPSANTRTDDHVARDVAAGGTVSDELVRTLRGGLVAPPPVAPTGNVRTDDRALREIGGVHFDPSVVVAQMRLRMGQIKACYERELRADPRLAGRIVYEFTIVPRGTITGAHVTENTLGSTQVAQCVLATIQGLRFNPGPEGGEVVYSYPFVFAPTP